MRGRCLVVVGGSARLGHRVRIAASNVPIGPTWGAQPRGRVRTAADGRRHGEERERTGVPAGGEGSGGLARALPRSSRGVSRGEGPRAVRGARASVDVPRRVGRRSRRGTGESRSPGGDVERHRPVQGRAAVPPHGVPRHAEVPRVRAGVQERAHDASARGRQGRRRLRSQGQERAGGHAVLPGVHDRAVPPHRLAHRRAGGRHRRRRARDRLPLRPVQAHHERVHRCDHWQGAWGGAAP